MTAKWLEKRRALPILALTGLVLFIAIKSLAPGLKRDESKLKASVVSVIDLKPYQAMPRAIGYGKAEPAIDFQEKSEISGRIVSVSPLLQKGELVKAGTEMLRIDDADYQLALASSQADLASAQASRAELEQTALNLEATKKLIEQKLALTEQELKRFERLRKQNSVSQSALDATRNTYIQQQQELTSTNNTLALLPSQRATAQARIETAKSAVATAERNLEHTRLILPYDARISDVFVENNQFVSTGANLFSAHAIDKYEIEVQLPLEQFAPFVTARKDLLPTLNNTTMQRRLEELNIKARISMVGGLTSAKWKGRVERISETLNPQSRTLGLIVTVESPYLSPGVRPPVMNGMYMQVELLGKPDTYLLLPRKALHQGELFSLTADNRLKRITVSDYLLAGDVVMLKSQQLQGTRIITSELFPAVDGMLVETVTDPDTDKALALFARGEGAIL